MSFEPIDLNVLIGPRDELWVSARSQLGAVYAVPRTGDQDWSIKYLIEDASAILADAVRMAVRDPDQAREIGAQLRDLLFGDPEVRALFQRTRGAAAARNRQLLVGVLGAPQQVTALPWELALDPQGGDQEFLTLAPNTHVVRLPRVRTYPVSSDSIQPPLQLLLVLSSPIASETGDDSLTFDLYEERRSVLDELAPLVESGLLVVDVEDHPSLENVRRRISARERGYHVIHYLGHALERNLVLENRQGTARNVRAEVFTELLQACPDLKLVVYAGCLTARLPDEGAEAADWQHSLSIADLSVRTAAPAVVGMQAELPFRTERLFTRFFYRALASGRSLADAMQVSRAAVRSDEFVGELLDWSVPVLFHGGGEPGPLVDVDAVVEPPRRRPRAELKLGLEEDEPAAFARPVALREAIDVLSGRRANRALIVIGEPEVRKPFVGRVLRDLEQDTDIVLHLNMERLMDEEQLAGEKDRLRLICRLLAGLLTQVDGKDRADTGDTGVDWWSRLVEDLVTRPAVIAIDDFDELPEDVQGPLARALSKLALRQTRTRIFLGGTALSQDALGERVARKATLIPLRPLEWSEVSQWVRRNIPELVRDDSPPLKPVYEELLQDDLESWIHLGDEVAGQNGKMTTELLTAMAERVVANRPRLTTPMSHRPPLTATLTNPAVAGRVDEFARWITALAADHDVGGRVSDAARATERSSIAELIGLRTPFSDRDTASDRDILKWMTDSLEGGVNVLLLDFGASQGSAVWEEACTTALQSGALLIAAGGNDPQTANYPAWYPTVLAVGPLGPDGKPADYASWDPDEGKPNLFAPEDLSWTRLADFVPKGRHGSSFAALGVTAAALLVWSIDRSMSASGVWDVLVESARRKRVRKDGRQRVIRALDVPRALALARSRLILSSLRHGPAGRRELLAVTGLSKATAQPLIDKLVEDGQLHLINRTDGVLYELSERAIAAPRGA